MTHRTPPFVRLSLVAFFALLIVAGCGGSGGGKGGGSSGGGDARSAGIFVDAPAGGVDFESDSEMGRTKSEGLFYCRAGEMVDFSIGGIQLGSALCAPLVSPIDLVTGAVNALNAVVTNIARVLQMLDEDQNLANGIQISEAVSNAAAGLSLDFNQSIAAFEGDAEVLAVLNILNAALGGPRSLPSVGDAQDHLSDTLDDLEDLAGVVSMSGTDVAVFGSAFAPTLAVSAGNSTAFATSWTSASSSVPVRSKVVQMSLINGDIVSLGFVTVSIDGGVTETHSYHVDCFSNPSRCNGIDVDMDDMRIEIDDVSLSPSSDVSGNQATADIELEGSLEIPPASS